MRKVGPGPDAPPATAIAKELGYYAAEEFGALAGVKDTTLESWRKRGKGPAWTRVGNRVYYPRQAVADFLESRLRSATTTPAGMAL